MEKFRTESSIDSRISLKGKKQSRSNIAWCFSFISYGVLLRFYRFWVVKVPVKINDCSAKGLDWRIPGHLFASH